MRIVLLALFLVLSQAIDSCQAQLAELTTLYILDKAKFAREVHGYVLYSGKMLDDLGLPESCTKFDSYSYFTGQAKGVNNFVDYRAYLGVCFSSKCSPEDINNNSGFIIKTVLNITNMDSLKLNFKQPSLSVESNASAIVFLIIFGVILAVSLKESVFNFFKSCRKEAKKEDEELYGKYAIQFGEDYDPTLLVIQQNQSFFKKMCIVSKLHQYFTSEESSKIISFSAFRIIAVPLALYGYLFYLCNIASYNYNAFADQIYNKNYTKVALAAYYIPDILFFISGFLLAKRGFQIIQVEPRGDKAILKLFLTKISRLIPLYWIFVIIYWQISPALHAGPVWYEYQGDAAICNGSWWRLFLFIDNWFEAGCYDFAWYIPAEIQLSLVSCCFLWFYLKNKKLGFTFLWLLFFVSFILTLVLSSPFPSSLETTLSSDAVSYFKSTYSHLPYYLFGVFNGYLAHSQKLKETMQRIIQNKLLRMLGITLSIFLIVLIVARPSVWEGQLRFELGLAKAGMFLGVYLLMFWTMFGGSMRKTVIHRLATLSKGALLMGGMVVSSYFWASYTFPYLDRGYLFNTTISNIFISIPAGGLVLALFWPRPRKEDHIIL